MRGMQLGALALAAALLTAAPARAVGKVDKEAISAAVQKGVKHLQTADPDKLEAEAATLFETVIEKFANIKAGRDTLGAQAKADLYEMRHLAVGKTVPEIAAEDLDGTKFKLSDYRGKVVLLDFWGNW